MQGKFRFSLDGVDATARQFSEVRRQLRELSASVDKSINRLGGRITAVEGDFESLGSDCSSAYSVANVNDADGFIPLDALRQVKWRVYQFKDDLNQRLDDAQPVVGLLAEDLDEAGLGFFCEYDDDDIPVGVDYPKLGMVALRLAQESMDEVDELRDTVESLSARIAKMEETYGNKSTVGE